MMKQATFLRRLKLALVWRLPSGEVRSIVDDYNGFFMDRMSEGKTEDDVCQEFGSPQEVAHNILQETGRNAFPLGLLVFLWTALAANLNWGGTWQKYQFAHDFLYIIHYIIQLALIPLLWLFWRKTLAGGASLPTSKKWTAVLWGGGSAAWAAAFVYSLWGLFVLIPKWQTLPPEAPVSGSSVGVTLGTLYDLAGSVLVVLIFLALLRTWLEGNPNYLQASAWCLGLHCSLNRQLMFFTCMDISVDTPFALARWEAVISPLIALAVVGLGGVLLTAFLIRKEGRHGRTT